MTDHRIGAMQHPPRVSIPWGERQRTAKRAAKAAYAGQEPLVGRPRKPAPLPMLAQLKCALESCPPRRAVLIAGWLLDWAKNRRNAADTKEKMFIDHGDGSGDEE